jgi:hypothetical protein
MKVNRKDRTCWRPVANVSAGKACQFQREFHQEHERDDVFMRLNVCSSYKDQNHRNRDKIGVVNLRTGKLSFVCPEREVRDVDAEVWLDD